jgi:hypothetical protein
VALLDPLALSFVKVRARPGWFVCDGAQIAQDAIFVPNRSTAERLEVGMRKEDVPADPGAVAEARALCEEYVRELPLLDARCRELAAVAKSHPDGVRERLAKHGITLDHIDPERGQPMFALTRAQRRALLDEVR